MKNYDVIIIGAGPAGIFAALELVEQNLSVLILEKGYNIAQRTKLSKDQKADLGEKRRNIVCGWGGAGAFSDGKLTLTTEYGGNLEDYIDKLEMTEKIAQVDDTYCSFGAADRKVFGDDNKTVINELKRKAAAAELLFLPTRIRHLGTDLNAEILLRIWSYLEDKAEVYCDAEVVEISTINGAMQGVRLKNGEVFSAKYLIAAPGREGSEWFINEAQKLGLGISNNMVDIGVRVELPAEVFAEITDEVYEAKLIYFSRSFDDRVRTFCMNPYGFVVTENNGGLLTVNGHSYAHTRSTNTNFALLVSKAFTEPFKEPIAYGKAIASLANMLGGGPIVQRLGDLRAGRRSTEERIRRGLVKPTMPRATPGDLSLVLPYRHLVDIMEMFEALDKIAPGTNSRHTLLYGVEVKFYSARLKLTPCLETEIPNFFAVGDGAGVTRSLIQASVSGLMAGREIIRRESSGKT